MRSISIYDVEDKRVNELCEQFNTTPAELIEALLDAVDAEEIKLEEWL